MKLRQGIFSLTCLLLGLAASLGIGAATETLRRGFSQPNPSSPAGSVILSEANIRRLVSKLSKMRGAALKMGQFMSIQGMHRAITILLRF